MTSYIFWRVMVLQRARGTDSWLVVRSSHTEICGVGHLGERIVSKPWLVVWRKSGRVIRDLNSLSSVCVLTPRCRTGSQRQRQRPWLPTTTNSVSCPTSWKVLKSTNSTLLTELGSLKAPVRRHLKGVQAKNFRNAVGWARRRGPKPMTVHAAELKGQSDGAEEG